MTDDLSPLVVHLALVGHSNMHKEFSHSMRHRRHILVELSPEAAICILCLELIINWNGE
jgi:hypothetical protein